MSEVQRIILDINAERPIGKGWKIDAVWCVKVFRSGKEVWIDR